MKQVELSGVVSKLKPESLLPSLSSNQKNLKTAEVKKKRGKVVQRNYILNDVGALKKKIKHEARKSEYEIGTEAKGGSNIMFLMKASFFEFVKVNMIKELEENENIVNIENAEGVKVGSENSGDAYVEYSMDVSFKASEIIHDIKLTAYTTTSKIMIQPKGEKTETKPHLNERCIPRYFVETFMLPWCEQVIKNGKYNENIGKLFANAIREEIKRLDHLKLDSKKTNKNAAGNSEICNAKCVARACSFQGLNPQNKSAVGECDNCGNFEHFACVKIKPDHKEDIINGKTKYLCSGCFSKNPMMIFRKQEVMDQDKPRHRLGSIPIMGQGYLFRVTQTTTATPIDIVKNTALTPISYHAPTTEDDDIRTVGKDKPTQKCDECSYETNKTEDFKSHAETNHKFSFPDC